MDRHHRGGVGRAPAHLCREGAELLAAHADPVGRLDEDLLHDVRAAETGVRWQPGCGVVGPLVLVDRAVDGHQVGRVVREREREAGTPCRGALAPRVREGDDVVDLHRTAGARPAPERHQVAAVRVAQPPRHDQAGLQGVVDHLGQPGGEDVVARVAPVAVHVGPRVAEELAPVALQGCRLHHRQAGQGRRGRVHAVSRHGERRWGADLLPPPGQDHPDREDERHDDRRGDHRP